MFASCLLSQDVYKLSVSHHYFEIPVFAPSVLSCGMERTLLRTRLISSSFSDIKKGSLDQRNRNINFILMIFLVLEIMKVCVWISLEETSPYNLHLGSFLMKLGKQGKVVYVALLFLIQNSLVYRMIFFIKEKSGELNFLFDPITFLDKLKKEKDVDGRKQYYLHEHFEREFETFFKIADKETKFRFILSNCYVTWVSLELVYENGIIFLPSFLFLSIIPFVISSILYMAGTAFTSCVWKTAASLLRMKIQIATHNIIRMTDEKLRNRRLNRVLKQIKDVTLKVQSYDSCLKWVLFSTLISLTPICCNLIYAYFFLNQPLILGWIELALTIIITYEGTDQMVRASKVSSDALKLYHVVNHFYVRQMKRISITKRKQLFNIIECLGNERRPISLYDALGEPYIPYAFFRVTY